MTLFDNHRRAGRQGAVATVRRRPPSATRSTRRRPDGFLPAREAAAVMRVSVDDVVAMAARGELEHKHHGHRLLVRPAVRVEARRASGGLAMPRRITVEIAGDTKGLERAFGRASKSAATFQASVTRSFSGLAAAGGFAIGIESARRAISGLVSEASGLGEALNKSNVVFGRSAGTSHGRTRPNAGFGISQRAALQAAGAFGSILETSGSTRRRRPFLKGSSGWHPIWRRSTTLIPARHSRSSAQAWRARRSRSARSGCCSQRPASKTRRTARDRKDELDAQRGPEGAGALQPDPSRHTREQSDFSRTSGSLANQSRILSAQFDNLRAKLGTALLPAILDATKGLNKFLSDASNQEKITKALTNGVKQLSAAFKVSKNVVLAFVGPTKQAIDGRADSKSAVKLLAAALVAVKVSQFATALGGIGPEAAASTVQVNALRGALLRLGAIGAIAIAVEVLDQQARNRQAGQELPDRHGTGFLDNRLEIPVDADVTQLDAMANKLSELSGEGNFAVKAIRKYADGLRAAGIEASIAADKTDEFVRSLPTEASFKSVVPSILGNLKGAVTGAQSKSFGGIFDNIVDGFTGALNDTMGKCRTAGRQGSRSGEARRVVRQPDRQPRSRRRQGRNEQGTPGELQRPTGAQDRNRETDRRRSRCAGRGTAARRRRGRDHREAQGDRQKVNDALQAAQFKGLGLDAEGNKPIPTIENLKKQLASLSKTVSGTKLDTPKLRSQFARIEGAHRPVQQRQEHARPATCSRRSAGSSTRDSRRR